MNNLLFNGGRACWLSISVSKEGAEIIIDNTQDTIFGGFAPNSQTAEVMSKSLGSRTAQSG